MEFTKNATLISANADILYSEDQQNALRQHGFTAATMPELVEELPTALWLNRRQYAILDLCQLYLPKEIDNLPAGIWHWQAAYWLPDWTDWAVGSYGATMAEALYNLAIELGCSQYSDQITSK